jgi:hypothetical protein
LFCLLITRDNSLSTEQKLKALNTFREPITGGQRGSSNIRIYAQCHSEALITTPLPPEGRLNVLNLWPIPEESGGGGLAEMFMTKGNEFAWPKPKNFPYLNGCQCTVINYTDGPVFNIVMPLLEVFREIIPDPQEPNTQHAGKIRVSRHWQINIDKIDPGIGNPFKFYIYNASDTMVLVSFPDTLMLQTGADDVSQNIHLIHSNVPMQFWPQSFE